MKGRYRFKTLKPITDKKVDAITPLEKREVTWKGPWVENLVMIGETTGLGLITARMAGSTVNDLEITTASIGKGTTDPTIEDLDLENPILEDISRTSQSYDSDSVMVGFFIPSSELPNDTYTEFAVFCGDQIFAKSLIDPEFTKSTNEDVGIEYTFLLGNFSPEE